MYLLKIKYLIGNKGQSIQEFAKFVLNSFKRHFLAFF